MAVLAEDTHVAPDCDPAPALLLRPRRLHVEAGTSARPPTGEAKHRARIGRFHGSGAPISQPKANGFAASCVRLAAAKRPVILRGRTGARPKKIRPRRNTMKTLVKTGLAALLLGTTGYAALAGTISGTIKGPDGAPFRAAFVRVQNLQTKMTMMVLSDNQGRYFDRRSRCRNLCGDADLGRLQERARCGATMSPSRTARTSRSTSPCRTAWSSGASSPSTRPACCCRRRRATARTCWSSSASTAMPSARSARSAATTCDGWKDEIDVMRQTGVARDQAGGARRGRHLSRRRVRPGFRDARNRRPNCPAIRR